MVDDRCHDSGSDGPHIGWKLVSVDDASDVGVGELVLDW